MATAPASVLTDEEKAGLYQWDTKYAGLLAREPLASHVQSAEQKILDSHWSDLKKLGEGSYGRVYGGTNKRTHQKEAIKILRVPIHGMDEFLREVEIAREVASLYPDHLLPIKTLSWMRFKEDPYSSLFFLVLPMASGGSLQSFLGKMYTLKPEAFFEFVFGIFCGLDALHKSRIVHNDLKPDNVLLFPDNNVKLADFGMSTLSNPVFSRKPSNLITASYRPPEYQCELPHVILPSADMWSAGIVLLEMLASFVGKKMQTAWSGPVYHNKDGKSTASVSDWKYELLQLAKNKGGRDSDLWNACFPRTKGVNPYGRIDTSERDVSVTDGLALLNSLFYWNRPLVLKDIPQEMQIYLLIASHLLRFKRSERWKASQVLEILREHAKKFAYHASTTCKTPRPYVRTRISERKDATLPDVWSNFQTLVLQELLAKADDKTKAQEMKQVQHMLSKWQALVKKFDAENDSQKKRDLFALVVLSSWGSEFALWMLSHYDLFGYANLAQATQRLSDIAKFVFSK